MTTLNMIGHPCPLPVIEAKKALRSTVAGATVTLLVDNDPARQNLAQMAQGLGHGFSYRAIDDGNIEVIITAKAAGTSQVGGADSSQCAVMPEASMGAGLVVAIGAKSMGQGSTELGEALMKSFIYSLTELEIVPRAVLFFNGGVHLTTEGSAALEDLELLVENGTDVASCGACLNYYELTEKLEVGRMTNMYDIVTTMSQASKLINI